MTQTAIWLIIALGVAVSIFLLVFSIKTWRKLKTLQTANQQLEQKQNASMEDSRMKAADSIKLIAQLMIEEQVELAEGCIRIKILLDHIAPELHEDENFSVFSSMYKATEHMPTHEARKQSDKKLIRKLDKERLELEETHKESILLASQKILVTNVF